MLRGAISLIVWILLVSAAYAEKRVALVVGNSAYQHTAKLANPSNDAVDMAAVRVVQPTPTAVVCAPEPMPIETLKVLPPPEEPSIASEWWFWTLIVGAAAAAAVGTGVGIAMQHDPAPPERELGETSLSEWSRQ